MTQVLVDIPDTISDLAESLTFSGTLDLPELTSGPDSFAFRGPLSWNVIVVKSGDKELLVTGTVQGTARATCGRCLDEFDLPLTGDIEGYWLTEDPGEEVPDDLAEDEFEVIGEDHQMDLFPFIQAALVLALPFVPLCREDCKGLCPQCGKNLNDGPCDCEPEEDYGIDPNNPFAVLKGIDFSNDN